MAQLVGADKGSRSEAARLGLLNDDEELSDDEKDKDWGGMDNDEEELNRVLKERHMYSLGDKNDYIDQISSSESEDEAPNAAEDGKTAGADRFRAMWC